MQQPTEQSMPPAGTRPTPAPTSTRGEFARRTAIVLGLALLFATFAGLLLFGAQVLLLAFTGILFGLLLRGIGQLLRRVLPLGPRLATAIGLLLFLGVLVGGFWFLGANIAAQVDQMLSRMPQSLGQVENWLQQYRWGRFLLQHVPGIGQALDGQTAGQVVGSIATAATTLLYVLGSLLVILFVGLYVAFQPHQYRHGVVLLFPRHLRPRAREVLQAMGHALQWWLFGMFCSMTIVAVLNGLGLWLLGVPLALTLALLSFFLAFVPNLGPIVSAIPAILMGWTVDPSTALWVVVLYAAVQTLESYVITPNIQRKAIDLPQALLILGQVLLGVLFGFMGLLVAAPLTAVVLLAVKMLYVEDTLGDRGAVDVSS